MCLEVADHPMMHARAAFFLGMFASQVSAVPTKVLDDRLAPLGFAYGLMIGAMLLIDSGYWDVQLHT